MMRIGVLSVLLILFVTLATARGETPANLIAGKRVERDAKLSVGTKLVAIFDKKNYLVEIIEVKANKKLKILWIESKDEADDIDLADDPLYYIGESTPTRKSKSAALPEAYRALDKNKDGQIGLYEWDRTKLAEFRRLDKNHDGFLTPLELAGKATTTTPAATTTTTASTPAESDKQSKEKPAPTNLVEYNDKVGETFELTLTGKADAGQVWGEDFYSMDSNLAAVAVHSGALKDGAKGTVSVTIYASVDKFKGTGANKVKSLERNEAGPAFTIKAVP